MQGIPAAGPVSVMQWLFGWFGVEGGWVLVVMGVVVGVVGLMVVGVLLISTNRLPRVPELGGKISSTRHLERLPVLQSPHLGTSFRTQLL